MTSKSSFTCSAAALVAALSAAGCGPHGIERVMAVSAYRPEAPVHLRRAARGSRYELLAGDMHCHVSPPDHPSDVSRDLAETIALARDEALDFVILTPHVPSRFFQDPAERAWVSSSQAELRAAIARSARLRRPHPNPTPGRGSERRGEESGEEPGIPGARGAPVLIPGFEYTDHRYGHVSSSFADVDRVLAEVPVEVARAHPERFFERWIDDGGVLVVNHPLVTPLDSFVQVARADLSWRPWTSRLPVPAEIQAVDRLATAFEAYNLTVTHLRDRFLVGDREWSLRGVLARLDHEILARRRRIAPVGGSDSHAGYLRATTFVLSESRTITGIRDAIAGGRTCVRSPAACSLEVRAPGGAWVAVGGAIRSEGAVEARARGDAISIALDGVPTASPESGAIARVQVPPGRCSLVRAHVDEGYSAPVYVNCDFAER
jgi:hypothetical protein